MSIPSCFRGRALAAAAALLLMLCPSVVAAQGTTVVPSTDLAYPDIDRLAELGVLDSVIIGQRPYSRREIGRIVRVARDRLDRSDRLAGLRDAISDAAATQASGIIQRLASRFEESEERDYEGPVFALLDGMSLTFNSTDAIRRGFPAVHTRRTEATIDPLAYRRLGDPAVRGQSTALDLSQRFEPTHWLAWHARERLEYRAPRDSTQTKTHGELLLAGMRVRSHNVVLLVGREQLAWSQSANDGLFLASDAPALDQISLSADRPFELPGVLRRLGPTQATVLYADLGASAVRSHSRLVAYKVSVQPHSSVELGGTFMDHFGGAGARPTSVGNLLVDMMPFIDIFRRHNYYDSTRTADVDSDKLLGIDGRWRIEALAGLTITGEVLIDDFDIHRLAYMFSGYGSSNVGLLFPQIRAPELSMKLWAKHMGIVTYTHQVVANGVTTRGRLLGDELGPDAKAFGGDLRWMPAPSMRLTLRGYSAQYSSGEYASYYADADSTRFVVYKTSSGINELRDGGIGTLELQDENGLALVLRAGAERIRHADFIPDARRKSYVASAALRLRM